MALPEWTNGSPNKYDYAINGIPFLGATNSDNEYVRQSAASKKDQIDMAKDPGEQSLQGWWYSSQSSFDLGAGIKFRDTTTDPNLIRRFSDSEGVNVFEPGQVTLLRKASRVDLSGDSLVEPGNHHAISYLSTEGGSTVSGTLVTSGTGLVRVPASGTGLTTVSWGGSSAPYDLTSDGGAYYAANSAGIYRGVLPAGAGTKIYSFANATTRAKVGYAKERLIIAGNQFIWDVPNTPGATPTALITSGTPTPGTPPTEYLHLFEHPEASWNWTAIADGPSCVYLAGYSGDHSAVYATRINPNSSDLVPELLTPYQVAELPRGERILSMITYIGTYLIMGTNKGVRIGYIDGNGNIVMGPLSLHSDEDVTALMATENFVWASGAHSNGSDGLYRLDLSKTITENALEFPWARDIYTDGSVGTGKTINSIVPIPNSDRIAYTVKDFGLVYENATDYVSSGWIETGKLRLDTAEDKIFQYVRVSNLSVPGSIGISWRDESGTLTSIGSYDTSAIRTYDTIGSDEEPHPWVSYRFTLTRGTAVQTPVMISYQSKAQPANVKQRNIKVSLMCFQREDGINNKVITRSVWDRVKELEQAEEKGSVVRFQDLGTGENRYCIIEQMAFISTQTPETRSAQNNPGGILTLMLRTVSPTV